MNNLKVSLKLVIGFGIIMAFTVLIGVISIVSLQDLDHEYSEAIDVHGKPMADAAHMLEGLHSMRAELRACIIFTGDQNKVKNFENLFMENAVIFEKSMDNYMPTIKRPEAKKALEDAYAAYKDTFKPEALKIIENAKKGVSGAELADAMAVKTKPAADMIAVGTKSAVDIKIEMLTKTQSDGAKKLVVIAVTLLIIAMAVSLFFGFYISNSISKPLAVAVKMIGELGAGHLGMRLKLTRKDEIGQMANSMDSFADDLQNIVVGTMKKISEGDLSTRIESKDEKDEIGVALRNTIVSLRKLIIDDGGKVLQAAANKDMTQRLTGEYKGEYAKMKDNINSVVKNLDEALTQVSEAVGQVSSASGEIASGSQSLAEGSNEQASSLEEVSSSLEEMSSMTKQNADNSNQAKILASEARTAADEGDVSMKRMAEAIHQIKQSSDNTAKIIKTIDDIAFQTNLLALNAAVEAARAGDAGKGFAVVAEEVRSLAMRSAEAAKNTADMIEESVKNSEGGVKITEEVAKSLNQIVDRTSKVGDLIAEIAAASNEQAQGIEQVNTAVAQMNQVTQSNAANSEESASAAEELNSQASELSNMVAAFKLSGSENAPRSGSRRGLPPPPPQKHYAAIPDKRAAQPKASGAKSAKAVDAEAIIPLDDDDLSQF